MDVDAGGRACCRRGVQLGDGLRNALDMLALEDWESRTLEHTVERVAGELELKMGKVAQPLRVAVVGRAASPGIDVTLQLVGKEATLRRIDKALEFIRQREMETR